MNIGGSRSHELRNRSRRLAHSEIAMLPVDILQSYLDDLGNIVMREKFDAYVARIQLPLRILTSSASLKIATTEDLKDGFEAYVEMIQSYGVTDMVRTAHAATFQGNEHVVGVYETRLMNEDRQVLPTFHSKMWIGCYGGVWKAIKIHNTTNETRWPMLLTRLASQSSEEF